MSANSEAREGLARALASSVDARVRPDEVIRLILEAFEAIAASERAIIAARIPAANKAFWDETKAAWRKKWLEELE